MQDQPNKLSKSLEMRTNIIITLVAITYRLLLDYIYVKTIATGYSYWGYHSNRTLNLEIVSWLIYILLFIPIRKYYDNQGKMSEEVIFILFVFSLAPFTTLIKYGHFDNRFIIYNTIFWISLYFGHFLCEHSRGFKVRLTLLKGRGFNRRILEYISWFFFIIVLAISGIYSGFRINFTISNSESIRMEAISQNLPTLLEYLYLWSQVIVPVLLAYYLREKKRLYIILNIVTQLLSYSFNGMKTTLLVTVVVIIVGLMPKFSVKKTNIYLLLSIVILGVIGLIEHKLIGTAFICGIVIMRMMFMPNSINYYYYDFFSSNTPDFFRSSFLRHFGFTSPYSNIPHTIGINYFHSDMGCNDGLIGDAFANFGVIGIVIVPLLIAFVLKLFDNSSKDLGVKLYIGCAFVIGIRLISNYLVTNLISYGFIILMILFKYMTKEGHDDDEYAVKD